MEVPEIVKDLLLWNTEIDDFRTEFVEEGLNMEELTEKVKSKIVNNYVYPQDKDVMRCRQSLPS